MSLSHADVPELHTGRVTDDAGPWKLELLRLWNVLDTQYEAPALFPGTRLDADTQQIFLVERAAFTTALALRKLAEAGKVSVQLLSHSIDFEKRPIRVKNRAPDRLNMHRCMDFYQATGERARTSYGGLANLLLHSRAFVVLDDVDDAGRLYPANFAVTSDRTHSDYLSVFSTEDLMDLVGRLAVDDIVQMVLLRDGSGGLISVGSREHMDPDVLSEYLDQAPHREAAVEIRRLITERHSVSGNIDPRQSAGP